MFKLIFIIWILATNGLLILQFISIHPDAQETFNSIVYALAFVWISTGIFCIKIIRTRRSKVREKAGEINR